MAGLTALVQAGIGDELIFQDGFENHPPVIVSSPVTTGSVSVPYSYDVAAEDIDGAPLLYLLTTSPTGKSNGDTHTRPAASTGRVLRTLLN